MLISEVCNPGFSVGEIKVLEFDLMPVDNLLYTHCELEISKYVVIKFFQQSQRPFLPPSFPPSLFLLSFLPLFLPFLIYLTEEKLRSLLSSCLKRWLFLPSFHMESGIFGCFFLHSLPGSFIVIHSSLKSFRTSGSARPRSK